MCICCPFGRKHQYVYSLIARRISANDIMCHACFEGLMNHWIDSNSPLLLQDCTTCEMPFFITWEVRKKRSNEYVLRGCCGTLEPQPFCKMAVLAVQAATQDERFPPIQASELSRLRVTVTLLGISESFKWREWSAGSHGSLMKFNSASSLPKVSEGHGYVLYVCTICVYSVSYSVIDLR